MFFHLFAQYIKSAVHELFILPKHKNKLSFQYKYFHSRLKNTSCFAANKMLEHNIKMCKYLWPSRTEPKEGNTTSSCY